MRMPPSREPGRVDAIGASRDRNEMAGTDDDNRTELTPLPFDGATPALDSLRNRVVGLFSRHMFAHLTRVTSKPASEGDKSSAGIGARASTCSGTTPAQTRHALSASSSFGGPLRIFAELSARLIASTR